LFYRRDKAIDWRYFILPGTPWIITGDSESLHGIWGKSGKMATGSGERPRKKKFSLYPRMWGEKMIMMEQKHIIKGGDYEFPFKVRGGA